MQPSFRWYEVACLLKHTCLGCDARCGYHLDAGHDLARLRPPTIRERSYYLRCVVGHLVMRVLQQYVPIGYKTCCLPRRRAIFLQLCPPFVVLVDFCNTWHRTPSREREPVITFVSLLPTIYTVYEKGYFIMTCVEF